MEVTTVGATFLVRVWMPDRPGALGAVATRLGAVRGDLLGIEILDRGAGLVVDELVVHLPGPELVPLMVREMSAVEGVEVEEVRPLSSSTHDPQLDAFEVAAVLIGAESADELGTALCQHVRRAVRADWSYLITEGGDVLAESGERPAAAWIEAYVAGCEFVAAESAAPQTPLTQTLWMPLPRTAAALVLGRDDTFLARERQRVGALARMADSWFARLGERSGISSARAHPSRF